MRIIFILLFLTSCTGIDLNLNWGAGDSAKNGITFQDEITGRTLRCDDPEFDKYACLSRENILELTKAMNSCRSKLSPDEKHALDSFVVDNVYKPLDI